MQRPTWRPPDGSLAGQHSVAPRTLNGDKRRVVPRDFAGRGRTLDERGLTQWLSSNTRGGGRVTAQEALEVVAALRREDLRPNIIHYNILLKAGRNWQWGLHVHRLICDQDIKPDSLTVATLLSSKQESGGAHLLKWGALLQWFSSTCVESDCLVATALAPLLAFGRSWGSVLDLFYQLRQKQISQDTVFVNAVGNLCFKNADWRTALLTVNVARIWNVSQNLGTYNMLATGYAGVSYWSKAHGVLAMARTGSLRPGTTTYNCIANAARGGRIWRLGVDMLQSMASDSLPPDVFTMGSLTNSIATAHDEVWSGCLGMLSVMTATSIQANDAVMGSILDSCSRWQKWQWSLLLLDTLAARGQVANAIHKNTALGSLQALLLWPKALQLFWRLAKAGQRADVVACNTLLSAFDRARAWEAVCAKLQQMEERSPTTITIVLSTYQSASQWEGCLSLLPQLQRNGYETDMTSVQLAKDGCSPTSSWLAALASPNVASRNTALKLSGAGGKWRNAIRHADAFNRDGLRPDVITCNVLVSLREAVLDWQGSLHSMLARLDESGTLATLVTYNAVAGICEKAGQWELSTHLVKMIPRAAMEPDTFSLLSVIVSSDLGGQWELALSKFRQDGPEHAHVAELTASISAAAGGSQWTWAVDSYRKHLLRMEKSKLPDTESCNAALAACRMGGNWKLCLWLWSYLRERSAKFDEVSYYCLALACGEGSRWDLALALQEEMREDGLVDADGSMRSAVVWSMEAAGADLKPALPSLFDNAAR
eukprot:TRINITY_DN39756_c0_g1_i4.p1 TRINITY_DN39756_c0_g1~~TRINITY_DN39756_c0_g1_i4.p1  ORF type:complete len:769 (-),score=108.29 TRINITY_DN39756_c0_g1_i4:124-2430(-)